MGTTTQRYHYTGDFNWEVISFHCGGWCEAATQLSAEGSGAFIMAASNNAGQFFTHSSSLRWSCHGERGPVWQVDSQPLLKKNTAKQHGLAAESITRSFLYLPCTRWDRARRPSASSHRTSLAWQKTRRISSPICLWLQAGEKKCNGWMLVRSSRIQL